MKKYILNVLLLLVIFLSASSSVLAAETPFTEGTSFSCPFYDPRNVTVQIYSPKTVSSAGSILSFTADVHNTSRFPVTDGSLLVRITGPNGSVYDSFFSNTNSLVLPAQTKVPVGFSWSAPAFALSGMYRIEAYVYSANEFSVGGIPALAGLFGGEATFSLISENKSFVAFDKASVVVDGQAYSPKKGFLLDATKPGTVKASITHNLKQKTEAVAVWKVYAQTSINEKNLVESFIEKIDLVPGKTAQSSFTFKDNSASEYEVVGEIAWKDAKSMLYTQVYRRGKSVSRLNFLSFGVQADGTAGLAGCVTSRVMGGDEGTFPKSVTVYGRDEKGVEVVQKTFALDRSPIMGFYSTFPNDYEKLSIVATISEADGTPEGTSQFTYDCSVLPAGACPVAKDMIPYWAIVACFGGFALALFTFHRHQKNVRRSLVITK